MELKHFSADVTHFWAATKTGDYPPESLEEIAFVGRSNVGKSSLINALFNRKKLVRTSNTPGATRALQFFNVADQMHVIDLPGYGFAKLSKMEQARISHLMQDFLLSRRTLKFVCVLVDIRHGFKESDKEMIQFLIEAGVMPVVVLTKHDKSKAKERDKVIPKIEESLEKMVGAYPEYFVTSSSKGNGMDELRKFIVSQIS